MPPGRRWRALAVVAVVLAAHAALLLGQRPPRPAAPATAVTAVPQVLTLVPVVVQADKAPAQPAAEREDSEPTAPRTDAAAGRGGEVPVPSFLDSDDAHRRAASAVASPAAPVASAAVSEMPQTEPVAAPADAAASAEPSPAQAIDAESAVVTEGDTPPPVYLPLLPGSTQLKYMLRRGSLEGEAQLHWYTDGARYRLEFRSRSGALPLTDQISYGVIDRHGVAPERFVDRRQRRAAQAANFLRDEGRIVFSGHMAEYRAWRGAQDRLGWILQLVGIHEAAAAAGQAPPTELSFFVVGARGGAGTWTFRLQGREQVDTPMGPVQALWLRREPDRLEDLRVDVWLDPARAHWPVRLRLTPLRGGQPLELTLAAEPAQ